MSTEERITQLISLLEGGNAKRFAEYAGIPEASMSRVRNGKASANAYIQRILAAYPEVRKSWLVSGEGSPLRRDEEKGRVERRLELLEKEVGRLASAIEKLEETLRKVPTKVPTD